MSILSATRSTVHNTYVAGGGEVAQLPMSPNCHQRVTKLPCTAATLIDMKMLAAIHQIDLRLLARIFRQGERRMVRPLARALSRSGDGYLHLLLPALVWLLETEYRLAFVQLLGLALLIERSLYWSLKNSLRRPRPQASVPGFRSLVTAADQFSFPSGHSSAAFLLATCVAVVWGGPLLALYAWAALVALSRVLLGVHFPGDTLAGALMGSLTALASASALGLW